MSQEPWKTDKWFVSPWNFAPEVRAELHFPKQVKFHDITLRDGEQQSGVIFTKDDKIRIAEGLAEAGVHRIEAGMPVVSPSDTAAIKEIVKRKLGPQIFAFSRCMVDDVKRAVDCGVSGIVMEVPSSTHIIEYAYKWPLEKAIDLSIESTAYAHSQGLEVVFFPIDFSRAEINTAMAMITAEVLGVEIRDVRPLVADTDAIGHNDVTGGSRITLATGMAVYNAAHDALRQLKARAAILLEKTPEEVEFRDGAFYTPGGAAPMPLKQVAAKLISTGGPVTGRASLNAGAVGAVGNAFASVCVDVEVDPETGKVRILRASIAQDVGRAIHPSYVEGQMQGGLAQGLGWALNEEYFYDERGNLRNSGLLDYRMPTCLDLPMLETLVVEVPNPSHPLGVRGVGEVNIVPPMAAVAEAIYKAVGVRLTELPMSPAKVLKAIMQKRQKDETEMAAAD